MANTIEEAFMGAAGSIESLVRALVRDELRKHLGPEADHLINVKNGPMSVDKLRRLVRSGELRGFKQGRDTFISASEFRAFIERRPMPPAPRVIVLEPSVDRSRAGDDDIMIILGLAPSDPAEHRAFEVRLAQRRIEGGERAASLRKAEAERDQLDDSQRRCEERRRKRAARKGAAKS